MNSRVIGGIQLLTACVIYGVFGFFYRYISEFGTYSQGIVRGSLVAILILFIIYFSGNRLKKINKKDIPWLIIWMIPSSLQPILIFTAFNNLPIGLVYFLFYAGILVSSFILGRIIFKEKLDLYKSISLLLAIIGIVLIYRSNIEFSANIYIFFSIIAGILTGIWNVVSKKVSKNYETEQMILIDHLTIAVSSLFFAFILKEPLNFNVSSITWYWMIGFVLLNIVSAKLVIQGFKKLEAQIGSLIMPTQIFFGAIIAMIFLNEKLSFNIYTGGLLILLAAILPYLKK